jgi:pimeloyl-ACP methyl ester carboxylesterase
MKIKGRTRLPTKRSGSIGKRMLLIVLAACAAFVCLVVCVLLITSPGQPEPFLDATGKPLAGSISEKLFLTINGVRQGMFIKGKDVRNPVLLYLHGGMPDYFLTQKYPTGLDEYFTVVWWEQRGSGMSYSSNIPRETMTVEQLIADTKELTMYLRRRFGKEKIYLMGHSGGTFFGIQAAARMPEFYHAYIGVAQMSFQLQSEKLAYDYMLRRFREGGNTDMVRKLEEAPVTMTADVPKAYAGVRDEAMHSFGIGTTHDMNSVITGIFLPSLRCREYTFMEKVHLWTGKSRSGISILWDSMVATDLRRKVSEVNIPVYFFHGIHDYTCSYTLAKAYFKSLKAPVKGFYTFTQSAHSPLFEEPHKMERIIRDDVLHEANALADRR